ncbi:MAG TPA: A/G-specific adenine glycosylase [Candidatus Paceibacterota bacterium]
MKARKGKAKAAVKKARHQRARLRKVKPAEVRAFRRALYGHYLAHRRDLPWRRTRDPYKILVSEAMLQQTQVPRVVPKFLSFIGQFPTPHALAGAPLSAVLAAWQGLGYNRRAKNLWHAAQTIAKEHHGKVPKTYQGLVDLPGVGDYTAGAILAFAFGRSRPIIETNVRTVIIHHFYRRKRNVTDREILSIVAQTLRGEDPRNYYAAIMDYGAYLKSTVGNVSHRSYHHATVKKTAYRGSTRQIRGAALRTLVSGPATLASLAKKVARELGVAAELVKNAAASLLGEGLAVKTDGKLTLP